MSYNVSWYVQDAVVWVRYFDTVDFNHIRASNHDVDVMISAGKKPVHVMIDVLALKDFPRNVFLIRRESTYFFNPQIGSVAVLTNNSLMRMMAKVIIAISPLDFHICGTLDEAMTYFAENTH